jgi:DDE superfamily endonuclease
MSIEGELVPFLLPAHSTHLLQPLEIGVFQYFKHYHQASSFQQMRNLTFRPHIISNAWKLAGLFPYNSKRVLDQMEVMSTPEPLSFSESFISSIPSLIIRKRSCNSNTLQLSMYGGYERCCLGNRVI